LDTDGGLWWEVSELFNNVVLLSLQFTDILCSTGDPPYPDHQKYFAEA
jgi:hypothetical protein